LKYFQEALDIDPKFAFAHAGVADCYTLLGFYGAMAPSVAMPKAKTAAMRALEIDDRLAEAHSSLGFARVFFDWDMDRAEKDFQRALELNPGYAPARYWYAALLTTVGRFEEATDQSERAQASDPLSVFASAHFGWMLIGARQHKRAIEQLERALELDPTFPLAYWLLGAACLHDSRAEESVAAFEKSVELSGNALWFRAHLAWALGQSGRLHEARTVLSDLKVRREEEYVRASLLAIVCVGSGELDEAMDWLERAYEERDMWMPTFQVDPLFDPLKADPRFVALMEKVRVA
ncbi:MAG: tetratricopeptide repeat protein, partial [Gemmatimonadota bacterium]|jgi:serine/threonine-protein kinase